MPPKYFAWLTEGRLQVPAINCTESGASSGGKNAARRGLVGAKYPRSTNNYSSSESGSRTLSTSNLGVRYTESGKKSRAVWGLLPCKLAVYLPFQGEIYFRNPVETPVSHIYP